MINLIQFLKKLTLDWGSLIVVLSAVIGIFWFLTGIVEVNNAQGQQLQSLDQDVGVLKRSIPEIQRSLGRIEGRLGTNFH